MRGRSYMSGKSGGPNSLDLDMGIDSDSSDLSNIPEDYDLPTPDSMQDEFVEDLGIDNTYEGQQMSALEKHGDLLKDLTNFNPYLKEIVNYWLGLTWNEKEKAFLPDPSLVPMMNLHCANWCVSFLKTYARDNNIITNIGDREFKCIMEDIIHNVWTNIGCRADEFGIRNTGDIQNICNILEHASMLVLVGAGGGKYNELLKDTTTRSEHANYTNGMIQQDGGMRPGRAGFGDRVKSWFKM